MCEMAYMATCSCGGLLMACVDHPAHKKDTAKEVSKCIKRGYQVSRVTIKEVKSTPFCANHGKCEKVKKTRK